MRTQKRRLDYNAGRKTKKTRTKKFHCVCCEDQDKKYDSENKLSIGCGYNCIRTKQCKFCNSTLFTSERHGWCCGNGATVEDLKREIPHFFDEISPELRPLYFTDTEFQSTMRKCNKLFCFSSMATDPQGTFDKKNGQNLNYNSCVCMTGRTYHRVLNVNDRSHRQKNNPMKWYLIDPADRDIKATNLGLNKTSYEKMAKYITENNSIAKNIKRIELADYSNFTIALKYRTGSSEIAAVFIDDERNVTPREFIYSRKGSTKPIQVSTLSGLYETMQYPCLNLRGGFGWDIETKKRSGLTQMKYYRFQSCYRLAIRRNDSEITLDDIAGARDNLLPPPQLAHQHWTCTNRLYGEYLVDMYSRMVDERILIWRSPSVQYRIASYREYDQSIEDCADTTNIGRVYLPANVNGSYRRSRMQVHNALHLVNTYGKNHFFITLTTNPMWADIQRHLYSGQHWSDRPDVVCRVFRHKLEDFCTKLHAGYFFGGKKVIYIIKVIEFQARGLPHAHIAVRMDFDDEEDVFAHVKAAVPFVSKFSTSRERRLHAIICKHNIHKNDGSLCTHGANTPNPCRCPNSVFCSKGFPKPYSSVNTFDDRGYPIYIREDPEDLFVVPYNAEISEFWDGHVK